MRVPVSCVWTAQGRVSLVHRSSFPALCSSNSGSRRSRPQAQSLWEIPKCNTIRPLRIMPAEKLAEFGTFSGKFHACLVHVQCMWMKKWSRIRGIARHNVCMVLPISLLFEHYPPMPKYNTISCIRACAVELGSHAQCGELKNE